MPCILGESDWATWLGEEPTTNEELLALLKPCPDEWLEIFPVDKKIGNVRNKGPEMALQIDLPPLNESDGEKGSGLALTARRAGRAWR